MEYTLERITPEKAKEWLKANPNNRTIKMRDVSSLMDSIRTGHFKTTHQGIAFDEEGNLVDGQHRLTAIALSEIPVYMWVCRGMPRDTMTEVDKGRGRTKTDRDTVVGKYDDNPVLRGTNTIGMIRMFIEFGGHRQGSKVNDWEIDACIEKWEDIITEIARVSKEPAGADGTIKAATLAAAVCGEPVEDIKRFYDVFLRGKTENTFGCNVSAAFNLYRAFTNAKMKGMSINKSKKYNLTQNALYQFLRGGTPVTLIRETKTERYPVEDAIKQAIKEATL